MTKFGMAIDLDACVGCGACALACKTENNTQVENGGRKYNWADYLTFTEGTFPQVSFKVVPVLCNHCTDAPCVEACPVDPKAMYKTPEGITMHNDARCIGCQLCVNACPYSDQNVDTAGKQYSVISYNDNAGPHTFWDDTTAVITGGTSSPDDVAIEAGYIPPYQNEYTHSDYNAIRPPDVTEKCIFCDHRLQEGLNPYCVDSCPAHARIFGDLDDPSSEVSQAIANGYNRLQDNTGAWLPAGNAGTSPNVYYIGGFTPNSVEIVDKPAFIELKAYPNPAHEKSTLQFDLDESSRVSIALFNVKGKEVRRVSNNEFKTRGTHKVEINLNGLSAGTYICALRTEKTTQSVNIVVTR